MSPRRCLVVCLALALGGCADDPAGPSRTDPSALALSTVTVGTNYACAIGANGAAYCWGDNDSGRLGINSYIPQLAPVRIHSLETFKTIVATSTGATCALNTEGEAFCWGNNQHGQHGDGTTAPRLGVMKVTGGERYVSLSGGFYAFCGETVAGEIFCWGLGLTGQFTIPNVESSSYPRKISSPVRLRSPVVGSWHVCALSDEGRAYCWGLNRYGQLGNGRVDGAAGGNQYEPTPVAGDLRFSQLAAGADFTCGIVRDGTAYCWGLNERGQLGFAGVRETGPPTLVNSSARFSRISAAEHHACGVTLQQQIVCWGNNSAGQLGHGIPPFTTTPVRISLS